MEKFLTRLLTGVMFHANASNQYAIKNDKRNMKIHYKQAVEEFQNYLYLYNKYLTENKKELNILPQNIKIEDDVLKQWKNWEEGTLLLIENEKIDDCVQYKIINHLKHEIKYITKQLSN